MYIVIIVIIILIFVLLRCKCGCWRWCHCGKCSCCRSHKFLESFTAVNNRRRVTLHYTNWCPNCIVIKPIWYQIKHDLSNPYIEFIEIDEDKAKTPGIAGYPTIRMLLETGRTIEYGSIADYNSLKNWITSPAYLD